MTRAPWLLLSLLAGCGRGDPAPAPAPPPVETSAAVGAPDAGAGCVEQPFAAEIEVPEASGAGWLEVDGAAALVVVGDSGRRGAYAVVDPATGAVRERGLLPLAGPDDDLEGLAGRGSLLYAISSPGWIRVFRRAAGGFELVGAPYALGPVDLDGPAGLGDVPPKGRGMVCDRKRTNCGRNYEGLCLAPPEAAAGARCVGFAAAKADGHLYCVHERDGALLVEYADAIKVARPGVIADCAFARDGTLYVGSNLFDLARVYQVDGWRDPATATVRDLGSLGTGFPEALAVAPAPGGGGGAGIDVWRLSDTGGAGPSLAKKYRCPSR